MTPERLLSILDAHSLWLRGAPDGVRANLHGAALRCARLCGANLRRADLRGANLVGAEMCGAELIGACLIDACLIDADLRSADLRGAEMCGADLRGAELIGACLIDADLSNAELCGATLPPAPVVPGLDARIMEQLDAGGGLDMGRWHATCGTTHCRAGWAVVLAGEEGLALEREVGTSVAGALIYHASTGRVPNFHASDADALESIRTGAAPRGLVPLVRT